MSTTDVTPPPEQPANAGCGAVACSALRPRTIHTLRRLRLRLKQQALSAGRYGPPYTEDAYDKRGPVPFRSFAYVDHVRHINALQNVIAMIEASDHTEHSIGMVKPDHNGDGTDMNSWQPAESVQEEKLEACPHAAPHVYCPECVVNPCPIGLGEKHTPSFLLLK